MKTKFSLALILIMIVSLAFQVTASQAAAGTYFTGTDNENNAHTGTADGDMDVDIYNDNPLHPIEFNISVPVGGLPATDAYLTIRAWDVDEEMGQQDEVFLNGTSLGFLSGTDSTWNTTAYEIPAGVLVEGNNLVQINVDTLNPPPDSTWLVQIDWGQVVVDGGIGTPGRINSITVTGYSVAGGSITLDVDVEIEALANGTFDLETNLYDPAGNSPDADLQAGFAMTAGQIVTKPVQFVFPAGANGDIYTIRGFLFDTATGLLNSIKSTTWTYGITTNTAPVANNETYATKMSVAFTGTTVLGNDTDSDSDPLTATLVTAPANASDFTFNADGTFYYEPANGFKGMDTFTYKANDGTSDSNVATVSINISPLRKIFYSINELDGWVSAFSQFSNVGNDFVANTNLRLGDTVWNQQYRSFLSFNVSSMPANAVTVFAKVRIKYLDTRGVNPTTTHGALVADIRTGFFGTSKALAAEDFNASPSKSRLGVFRPISTIENWWQMIIGQADYHFVNTAGITQFRLRFVTQDDNDKIEDRIRFSSGDTALSARPMLIVYYYIPHP